MQIQISWLLQKPTDLDLHCLQRQGISGFSRTSVKILHLFCHSSDKLYSYFSMQTPNLTLVLLNPDMPWLCSVDPDQLAFSEVNWSGSALFVIQKVNLYHQPGSSNLAGWQLDVGRHLNLFNMARVKTWHINPYPVAFASDLGTLPWAPIIFTPFPWILFRLTQVMHLRVCTNGQAYY